MTCHAISILSVAPCAVQMGNRFESIYVCSVFDSAQSAVRLQIVVGKYLHLHTNIVNSPSQVVVGF